MTAHAAVDDSEFIIAAMSEILIPVSPGELLDKITILRIKSTRMTDPAKLDNVRTELALLEAAWRDSVPVSQSDAEDAAALGRVNEKLWDIEDRLRDKESTGSFDGDFIELARAVYRCNDERAALKRRINLRLGSRIVEEKSYRPYGAPGSDPSPSGT